MEITAIRQQLRKQGRYSIFVAGKYAFSLSDTALLESKLIVGQVLSTEEIAEWQQRSQDDKLYNQVLQYIALRPRSQWEISQYLYRKKADPLLSQQIVSKLSELRLLNDLDFARAWVASRRLLKAVSYRRLQQELRVKRISSEIVVQVLAEDDTDEQMVLQELVAKKRQQSRYQDDLKLMQFLARQGYQYDAIKQALQVEN